MAERENKPMGLLGALFATPAPTLGQRLLGMFPPEPPMRLSEVVGALEAKRGQIKPNGRPYTTRLSDIDEMAFRAWQQKTGIPFDADAPVTDYDLRGYWQAMRQQNPKARAAEVSAYDGMPHLTDYWKTPLHHTFSAESQWANPATAPRWDNDMLYDRSGRLIADERPKSKREAR